MNFLIGIFVATHSMENIRRIFSQYICNEHSFVFIEYNSTDQLLHLFQQQKDDFDGVLFGGPLPYHQVMRRLGPQAIPSTYIDLTRQDYYRVLLQVIYQNPRLDIRRIWIDRPTINIPWSAIFGAGHVPQIHSLTSEQDRFELLCADDVYSTILSSYLDGIHSGSVDYIITRVTNLIPYLTQEGIPCAQLTPGPDSVCEAVDKLIQLINSQKITGNLLVVGCLKRSHNPADGSPERLSDLLRQFNREYGFSLILHQTYSHTEIMTNNAAFQKMTQDYSCCSLSAYLNDNLSESFFLGWGIGNTLLQAQQNAKRALNESSRNANRSTYLVNENDELIGPLGESQCISLSTKPTHQATILSKKIGISITNAQKIIEIYKKNPDLYINRNNLSQYLNITVRTANRILTKLLSVGGASLVEAEQHNSAGRPISVYQLRLNKLLQ